VSGLFRATSSWSETSTAPPASLATLTAALLACAADNRRVLVAGRSLGKTNLSAAQFEAWANAARDFKCAPRAQPRKRRKPW